MKGQIEWRPPSSVLPYERNARIIPDEAVDAVAESIKRFGFRNPIIVDREGVIICGHTRHAAAQKLELEQIPVLVADDLSEEQVKAFRLADNKSSEFSSWDNSLLFEEIESLKDYDADMTAWFADDELWRRRAGWKRTEKYCDLSRAIKLHIDSGLAFSTLYKVGKRGMTLEEIKASESNAALIGDNVSDFLLQAFGANISAGEWCLLTAPRRRHKEGLHFSTAVCEYVSKDIGIKFYPDAFRAEDRNRIEPHFELVIEPKERNVIWVDDVISTSQTARECKRLLDEAGYVTFVVATIKNNTSI